MMKGLTLEFALERVFELERKEDVIPNRKMIDNYVQSLKNGLEKNKKNYLEIRGMTEEDLRLEHGEKRHMSGMSKKKLSQYEVRGYDKMIERILDVPEAEKENPQLRSALAVIKNRIQGGTKADGIKAIEQQLEKDAEDANQIDTNPTRVGKKGPKKYMNMLEAE